MEWVIHLLVALMAIVEAIIMIEPSPFRRLASGRTIIALLAQFLLAI